MQFVWIKMFSRENFFFVTITIKKLIRINQTLNENFSSNPDFLFSIKPWLKIFERTLIENRPIRGTRRTRLLHKCLTFHEQTLIEFFSADFDGKISSKLWMKFFHRDHDHDWKLFRKNQGSIFKWNSISDFRIKIDPWNKFSNRSAIEKLIPDQNHWQTTKSGIDFFLNIGSRFWFQNRLPVLIFKSGSGFFHKSRSQSRLKIFLEKSEIVIGNEIFTPRPAPSPKTLSLQER